MAGIYVALGGVLAILLPAQVARIDPDGKVAALAVISSVSFAVTLFAQPLIGALSDRTLAKWGGRASWIVGSAAVGALAVAALGSADTILAVCLLWALGQFALNGADVATSSYVVDAYPIGRRGTPSGVLAASVALGTGIGAVLAGVLVDSPGVAFGTVAGLALLGAAFFVVVNREKRQDVVPSSAPREPWKLSSLDPRRHPDFAWAISARFFLTLGQQAVSVYLLYIVADLFAVGDAKAPLLVSALTATGLVGLLVSATIAGLVSDRLGRRRIVLVVSSAVLVVAMLLPLVSHEVPILFLFAGMQGLALGGHLASAGALISEVLPAGDRAAGRDLGVANMAVNAAQALAPLVGGAVILLTGGYMALFVVAIIAAIASAASALRVRGVR